MNFPILLLTFENGSQATGRFNDIELAGLKKLAREEYGNPIVKVEEVESRFHGI